MESEPLEYLHYLVRRSSPKLDAMALISIGFVLLPGFLSQQEQRQLIRATLEDHARYPNENNLDTHYQLPTNGLWRAWKEHRLQRQFDPNTEEPVIQIKASTSIQVTSESRRTLIDNDPASIENFAEMQAVAKVPFPPSSTLSPLPLSCLINKLRWSNIGHFYHWGTKSYQFDRELVPIPGDIKETCRRAVINVQWSNVWKDGADLESGEWEMDKPDWDKWHETFCPWAEHGRIPVLMNLVVPDAGIINFYQLKVSENVCPAWRGCLMLS
jgi:alkylated DNA repair protein alkB family protein 1